jgi:hypothetical protein
LVVSSMDTSHDVPTDFHSCDLVDEELTLRSCLMVLKVSSLVRWCRSAYTNASFSSAFNSYVPLHIPVAYP